MKVFYIFVVSFVLLTTAFAQCPSEKPYKIGATTQCVAACPPATPFLIESSMMCETKCPAGKYKVDLLKKCVDECPASFFREKKSTGWECNLSCSPQAPNTDMTGKECVIKCDGYIYGGKCYEKCPGYFKVSDLKCSGLLTDFKDLYMIEGTSEFVSKCPDNKIHDQRSVPFMCVSVCTGYLQASNNTCHNLCPSKLFTLKKECVAQCPAYNFEGKCLDACPFFYSTFNFKCLADIIGFKEHYLLEGQREFVQKCPNDKYTDKTSTPWTCVSSCPYFYTESDKTCSKTCPAKYFITGADGRACVTQCPRFEFQGRCLENCPVYYSMDPNKCSSNFNDFDKLYLVEGQREFVKICPKGFFYDEAIKPFRCVKSCPFYYSEDKNVCSKNCVIDGVSQSFDGRKCVSSCPVGMKPLNRICE